MEKDIENTFYSKKVKLREELKKIKKKHKEKKHYISYYPGDLTDSIVRDIQKMERKPKTEILRNALMYYKLFLEKNFDLLKLKGDKR